MSMPPYDPKMSSLIDQAVTGRERTTGRARRLWNLLLGTLLRLVGL